MIGSNSALEIGAAVLKVMELVIDLKGHPLLARVFEGAQGLLS